MGIGEGVIKYMIFTPITVVGFVCLYLYGGALITLFNTWMYLFSGKFIEAFIEYYIKSALPPTSIAQVLGTVFVGTVAAGAKWFIAMALMGHRL